MDFLLGILVGVSCGILILLFIQGASLNERETDIYMEGFNDGQNAPRYTKSDFPLQEKE